MFWSAGTKCPSSPAAAGRRATASGERSSTAAAACTSAQSSRAAAVPHRVARPARAGGLSPRELDDEAVQELDAGAQAPRGNALVGPVGAAGVVLAQRDRRDAVGGDAAGAQEARVGGSARHEGDDR